MVWIGVRAPEGIVLNVDTSKEVGDVGQLKESKYVVNVFRLFLSLVRKNCGRGELLGRVLIIWSGR
jgi:hypothetical protein